MESLSFVSQIPDPLIHIMAIIAPLAMKLKIPHFVPA